MGITIQATYTPSHPALQCTAREHGGRGVLALFAVIQSPAKFAHEETPSLPMAKQILLREANTPPDIWAYETGTPGGPSSERQGQC